MSDIDDKGCTLEDRDDIVCTLNVTYEISPSFNDSIGMRVCIAEVRDKKNRREENKDNTIYIWQDVDVKDNTLDRENDSGCKGENKDDKSKQKLFVC